jgi:hypothetical protein
MGGINKKFVGNPLGYFRKQKDAQLKKAQDANVDNVVKPYTVSNRGSIHGPQVIKQSPTKAAADKAAKDSKIVVRGTKIYSK